MPLLANPADVLTDLGFDTTNMPNITNATAAALNTAEVLLGSALGTVFTQQQVIDNFFVKEPTYMVDFADFRTEFRLSQGFVSTSVPIIAVMTTKSGSFWWGGEGMASTPTTLDVSGNMMLDSDKGLCVDETYAYFRKWVKFTYTAGFPLVADSDPASYDLTVVPQWLQMAAKHLAKTMLQSNPSLEDPAIKLDTQLMQRHLNVLLMTHLRYAPLALLPSSHTP